MPTAPVPDPSAGLVQKRCVSISGWVAGSRIRYESRFGLARGPGALRRGAMLPWKWGGLCTLTITPCLHHSDLPPPPSTLFSLLSSLCTARSQLDRDSWLPPLVSHELSTLCGMQRLLQRVL